MKTINSGARNWDMSASEVEDTELAITTTRSIEKELESHRDKKETEIPLTSSEKSLEVLSQAESESMNLIDSSLLKLKHLMNVSIKSCERGGVAEGEAQMVGAVTNIAKQMTNLIRVKLDIAKMAVKMKEMK